MKLFSSIATAAVVAASTTFMAAPAEARSSTCWASDNNGSMTAMTCDVTRRINNNGHVVWDVGIGSEKVTFVLWTNGVGEAIWADGTQRIFKYHLDSDGDPRLTGKGGWQFSFRA